MTEPINIRRVVSSPVGNVLWIVFRQGNIGAPLALLTDTELDILLDSIDEQTEAAEPTV